MEKIVNKDKLIRYIKKKYGNLYSIEYIKKTIEEIGSSYFEELNIKYMNYSKWKIVE